MSVCGVADIVDYRRRQCARRHIELDESRHLVRSATS
jgi:hypothetical protein